MKNRHLIWILIFLLPPIGLALLWMRTESRFRLKLAGSLAAVLFVLLHLVLFWHLRIELSGGYTRPFVGFKNTQSHYEEIENLRSKEQSIDGKL
jgi:hypothetical protein